MEGSIYFLLVWIMWIVATFFMRKNNPIRTKLSIYILLSIILVPYEFQWGGVHISVELLFILLISFYYVGNIKWNSIIYVIVCSFFTMIAYITIELTSIIDPVWLFLPKIWLRLGILLLFVVLIQKVIFKQILTYIIGNVLGEVVFHLILRKYGMYNEEIGNLMFLDSLMLGVFSLLSFYYIKCFLIKMEQYVLHIEKQKQKNI